MFQIVSVFSGCYKKAFFLCGCVLLLLLSTSSVNAGLFSTLSKMGKAVKNADIDISLNKMELPDNLKDYAPVTVKVDADGQWAVTQADGTVAHIDEFFSQSTKASSKPALVIRASDLPDDMSQFFSLPHDLPVFIQGKKGRLFEFQRKNPPALIYNNVLLRVNNIHEIRDGLWMLQRPSMTKAVHFFRLDEKAPSLIADNASNLSVNSVAADGLLSAMKAIKNQTLVLSGRIVDGQLLGTGKSSVSMEQLRKMADENDIHLFVLDSDKPALVLKKVSGSMRKAVKNNLIQFDTIGDFFNRLSDSSGTNKLELHASRSGRNQIAIQWKSDGVETNVNVGALTHMPLHLLLHSSLSHMPDRARSRELEDRIIPGIPSMLQFYVIASVVLGFTALGTSWRLWRKLWLLRARKEYKNLAVFLLLWPLHRLGFLLIFIPMFGLFSFIWLLLSSVYKIFDWVLFRPTRYFYRLLAA